MPALKLAHLCFVIHGECKQQIIKMGEEGWMVFNMGFPGLDKDEKHGKENIIKRRGQSYFTEVKQGVMLWGPVKDKAGGKYPGRTL